MRADVRAGAVGAAIQRSARPGQNQPRNTPCSRGTATGPPEPSYGGSVVVYLLLQITNEDTRPNTQTKQRMHPQTHIRRLFSACYRSRSSCAVEGYYLGCRMRIGNRGTIIFAILADVQPSRRCFSVDPVPALISSSGRYTRARPCRRVRTSCVWLGVPDHLPPLAIASKRDSCKSLPIPIISNAPLAEPVPPPLRLTSRMTHQQPGRFSPRRRPHAAPHSHSQPRNVLCSCASNSSSPLSCSLIRWLTRPTTGSDRDMSRVMRALCDSALGGCRV